MTPDFDLLIIGGGINGCGIARDATGRGLRVCLSEMNDLASATSASSTKLFHGGLRYLEYFEFRLVREALIERENLLRAMPHISWPMRFVLPFHDSMRFDTTTPTSKLLGAVMPWMKGRRPAWMIRLGLFIYDHLGGREILPATSRIALHSAIEGKGLNPKFEKAYEYSDCWVEDSRLVVLNARDAQMRGAQIRTRSKVISAEVSDGIWHVEMENADTGDKTTVTAAMVVNASGPWVGDVLRTTLCSNSQDSVRLVRGSHIVTKKLFDHDKCYFFQGTDGRIIFAIPYETDFTLIGTTDQDHDDASIKPECTPEERDYLITFINEYLAKPISADDVVWTYSGVRPLYNDGASSASAATRDYVLKLDTTRGAPFLNVFGGKITTYRCLAEGAMEEIEKVLPVTAKPWTAGVALPGGDFAVDGVDALVAQVKQTFAFLSDRWALRLVRAYGTEVPDVLGNAQDKKDLGQDFGADLFQREVQWLMENEFVRTAEDVVWRRSKLGLRMSSAQISALDDWIKARLAAQQSTAAE
ncbi:glycerol-3-phosphate dehydrogenase [Aliiroseovarius sp. PrR006]|uniref:glycerol-3-phosphate dehydrogenase n=1 Tax=Aliiroseovarius sp. PrR006 TaxID=2706883 RepID=UPI0013D0255A|nr:glycerol-3-phosphate dehydrogenase [Aliiroseovarius sp. PrR006]NDW52792.1 glycerol-3-phosphate dehydrogenase [Aliiroseovarius sp. PrR006]